MQFHVFTVDWYCRVDLMLLLLLQSTVFTVRVVCEIVTIQVWMISLLSRYFSWFSVVACIVSSAGLESIPFNQFKFLSIQILNSINFFN